MPVEAYHAWISTYVDDKGWVDDIIEFDGKDWQLMDPTLAASNDKESVKKYVNDGNQYCEIQLLNTISGYDPGIQNCCNPERSNYDQRHIFRLFPMPRPRHSVHRWL
ncbi:MAG: hypothetical protein V8S14_03950 [Lachnospiraceae bacterium]